jgi:hypothetical protein
MTQWTVDTLKEHVDVITARQDKAVADALTAAKEAVAKAEIAAEKRFDAANEFRGQLSDQAATFMPRSEAEQIIEQLAQKVNALEKARERSAAAVAAVLALVAAAGVLFGIINAIT